MLCRKNIIFIISIFVLLFSAGHFSAFAEDNDFSSFLLNDVYAQNQSETENSQYELSLTEEEIAWLKANPDVAFAFPASFEPYMIKDSEGNLSGILVDFLALLNSSLGVNFKPVSSDFKDVDTKLKNKEIEGLLAILPEGAAARNLLITAPTFTAFPTVFVHEDAKFTVKSMADLKGKTVAIFSSDQYIAQILQEHRDSINIVKTETSKALLELVFKGEVDAAVGITTQNYLIYKYGMTGISPVYIAWDNPLTLSMGVRKEFPHLLSILNKGISQISRKEKNAIMYRWLSVLKEPQTKLNFTAAEKAWLQKHPVIKIGLDPDFAPYSFIDEKGVLKGAALDFVRRIEELIGIVIEPVTGVTWKEVQKETRNRAIDLMTPALMNEERREYLLFSDMYLPTPLVITTRADDNSIKSAKDLIGRRVAVATGYASSRKVIKEYPGIIQVDVATPLAGLQAVSTGKADAYVCGMGVNIYLAIKNGIANLKVAAAYEREIIGQHFGIRSDWPELVPIFNKALRAIPESEKMDIIHKWVPVSFTPKEDKSFTGLTQEEENWLKEHPVIRVGCDPGWAPIEYRNEHGKFEGISVDYLRMIENMLPVKLEIDTESSWQQLVEKAKVGEIDLFTNLSPTSERESYLSFTEPYLSLPVLIYTRDDVAFVPDINGLDHRKIAIVKDYAIQGWLEQDYPDLNLVLCETVEEGLNKLASGEVFAYLGNLVTTGYYILKKGHINIKVAGETTYSYTGSMAVRADWPILADIVQKTLNNISKKQRNDIYSNWISIKYEHEFDYALLWRILGLVFLLIIFFIWSNIRLRNAVRKRTEELTASEMQYRTLFESANDAILILKNSTIFMCNKKADDLFQCSEEGELIGFKPHELSPEFQDDKRSSEDKSEEKIANALSGNPQFFEWQHKKQSGEIFYASISLSPIKIHSEICILSVVRDISEKKKAREDLIAAKEKAEESDKLKTAFLAGLSHEIRTPMNGILGFAQLLKDTDLSVTEKEGYIQTIEKSGNRMLNIINDLVDVSTIESGQLTISTTFNPMNDLMLETFNFFKVQAAQRGIDLKLDLPKAKNEIIVNVDKDKTLQVLSNLVTNAFKFTSEGSITLGYVKKDNMVEVYVKDTGIGVDKAMYEVIFDRFRQIDISYSRNHEGAGLGLAISKAFVEEHGGKIWLDSEKNKGTTFYFTLPVSEIKTEELEAEKADEAYSVFSSNTKVLIVEDDFINYKLLDEILKRHSIETVHVSNGQDAVDVMRGQKDIDLILMDLQLPGMDGVTATKIIKEHHSAIPVIAQSAFVTPQDIQNAFDCGCCDFIKKPIDQKILLSTISHFL